MKVLVLSARRCRMSASKVKKKIHVHLFVRFDDCFSNALLYTTSLPSPSRL